MRRFTETRDPSTTDEIWFLEHPPIFTLGLNGNPANLLHPVDIPVIKTDRGGQITWHGPGQLIAYILLDMRRLNRGIRTTVTCIETAVTELLANYGISATTRNDAPGVYVNDRKIASIGLRVHRGCTYHGLSLNVNPDLLYFSAINPCGYLGLEVTSLKELGIDSNPKSVTSVLAMSLLKSFGYS